MSHPGFSENPKKAALWGSQGRVPARSESHIPDRLSSEPPEWSSLVQERAQSEIPLTAEDYLQQMAAIEQARALAEGQQERGAQEELFVVRVRRWLPIIVVALLLLGLCGALLSAAFLG